MDKILAAFLLLLSTLFWIHWPEFGLKRPQIKAYNPQVQSEQCAKNRLKGKLKIDLEPLSWARLEAENVNNSLGGRFEPNCTARHKVAILIPYRDRDKELRILLHHLHPILQRQHLTYGIFVIEQVSI